HSRAPSTPRKKSRVPSRVRICAQPARPPTTTSSGAVFLIKSGTEFLIGIIRALEQLDPNNPTVLAWRRQQEEQANPLGEDAIRRVRTLLGPAAPGANAETPRQLLEHIAVLDTLDTTS